MSFVTALLTFLSLVPDILASPAQVRSTNSICGRKGYDLGVDAHSYTSGTALANFNACGAKCAGDSRCNSFAFGSGACLLYKPAA